MVFVCVSDCEAECCGIIPLPKDLAKRFEHLKQRDAKEVREFSEDKIMVFTDDLKCVFLSPENKCVIYEKRPGICREYGLIEEMQCPYVNMNGNRRSPAKVRRMQRIIGHQVDGIMKRVGTSVR